MAADEEVEGNFLLIKTCPLDKNDFYADNPDSFDLEKWLNIVLTNSGLNTLVAEPVWTKGKDKELLGLDTLSIKQIDNVDRSGFARPLKQKLCHQLNITFLDDHGQQIYFMENVFINAEDKDSTSINLAGISEQDRLRVRAILINEGNHAYAKIQYDEQTLAWLTANLHLV